MSLRIGKTFVEALRQSDDLARLLGAREDTEHRLVGARIFAVARQTQDEQEDRIPYVIMMPEGISASASKDDYEETDLATVSLLCVADTYQALISLTEQVRETVAVRLQDAAQAEDFRIDDYSFAASAVSYDADKPCYFQTLTYQCATQIND